MTMKDAVQMATRDTALEFTEKEAVMCYGLSKMTIKNEMDKGGAA